ncbi:hypothetical protein G7Z17_g2986 [Cylindrodendrum hubeiense]|uniref:Uncharacterized protein n=1 Tax=Cylindrodendrum hubeiense TaxID=595255 RepID=A0A9P5LIL0_9HYPO|nr:hypothetical protein G7Z17_g2986 [Cylindrodendrum hubeiense]
MANFLFTPRHQPRIAIITITFIDMGSVSYTSSVALVTFDPTQEVEWPEVLPPIPDSSVSHSPLPQSPSAAATQPPPAELHPDDSYPLDIEIPEEEEEAADFLDGDVEKGIPDSEEDDADFMDGDVEMDVES